MEENKTEMTLECESEEISGVKDNAPTTGERPRYVATTKYTLEALLEFNNSHTLSKAWLLVIFIVASGLVLLSALVELIMLGYISREMLPSIIMIILLDLIWAGATFILPRFTYKKSPAYESNVIIECYEDSFVTIATTDKMNERTEVSYSAITAVRESKNYIYLYIAANQAHIVSKAGIEDGDIDGFVAHIRKRADHKAFKRYREVR